MPALVKWLPKGHIAHGYRRVFVLYDNDILQHVVTIAPMPYEQVFHIQQLAGSDAVKDPSLWWGLSIVASLVANGTLLNPTNQDVPDDGYLQVRPQPMTKEELLPLDIYQSIEQEGEFVFSH